MIAVHLTPDMVKRTVALIDDSGVLDLIVPPAQPKQPGRPGRVRPNTRLLLIGLHLCVRLGHETTLQNAHRVLTEALSLDAQLKLGVIRKLTSRRRIHAKEAGPNTRQKTRKERDFDNEVEKVGYDDLVYAARKMRERLDFGLGSAPNLDDDERAARRDLVEDITHQLLAFSSIEPTNKYYAIDATGQWAWSRGSKSGKSKLDKALKKADQRGGEVVDLIAGDIGEDANGNTAPTDQAREAPAGSKRVCQDAAWGYRTGKFGAETGFGFHMHTMVRVADPGADPDSTPRLIDGFIIAPANAPVPETSLRLAGRVKQRNPKFEVLIGDRLYTHLLASKWAIPLGKLGIAQHLSMREDNHGISPILGGQLQHGWLHCPAAPMERRPLPLPDTDVDPETWQRHFDEVEEFRHNWAFDRHTSGLTTGRTTKWICPAEAGRVVCGAKDALYTDVAAGELPVVIPPDDWQDRPCCTKRVVAFTPEADEIGHQRKLMQREYFGSRRWRQVFSLRSHIEGAFGILKNSSRHRMRRGQSRLPGLAFNSILDAIKISLYNEEVLREWHDRTGLGPAEHPLLQPDAPYYGFGDLTHDQARQAIDAHLAQPAAASAGLDLAA